MSTTMSAAASGIVAFLLITGGISKGVDRQSFREVLLRIPKMRSSAQLIAAALPPAEVAIGLLSLVSRRASVLVVAGCLFLGFAAVSASTSMEDCKCGPFVPRHGRTRILMNLAVGLLAFAGSFMGTIAGVGDRILVAGMTGVVALIVLAPVEVLTQLSNHEHVRT